MSRSRPPHRPIRRAAAGQRGFTYLAVLMLVAIGGIALAAAGEVWHTGRQRERERELLFIGQQFRLALAGYARYTPGPAPRAPLRLEDLLQDPRTPAVRRDLRRIYVDPMTGQAEWGLVTGPAGEIYGVHSLSRDAPLKTSNFALADRPFEAAARYSDWVFMQSGNEPRPPAGAASSFKKKDGP